MSYFCALFVTKMTEEDIKILASDPDGLRCYEYLANNIENCDGDMDTIIDNLSRADINGQFSASAARYLHAIDAEKYAGPVARLVEVAIERDREHRYLPDILQSLYGPDYESRASELNATDNNFRRIYKRLYPSADSL